MDTPFDHAVGPDDQQASRGPLAHLCRGPKPLFAVGRMLSGREARPHLMTQFPDFAPPEMSPSAGFHGDDGMCQLAEERQHLIPPQLLAQHRSSRPRSVSPWT
jgi:hypothetical protein